MKRYRVILLLKVLVAVLLLVACNGRTEKETDSDVLIIDYNNAKEITFDKFFDFSKTEIIQFEHNDSIFLSERLEFNFADSYIFVLDIDATQLYRFDMQGKLINKIGTSGSGPAEYNNVSFFQVNKSTKTIDILCDAGTTIKTFEYNGNYIKHFNTPFPTQSFAQLNSNLYFFYSGFHGSDSHKRLHLCDTTDVINSYLYLKTNATDVTEQNFTSYGTHGLFRESFFPSIYRYDSLGIEKIIRFNFGNCDVTENLKECDDLYQFFEDINNRGFCTTKDPAHQGKKITYIKTMYQIDMEASFSHFYINMEDSTYKKVISNEKDKILHDLFYQLRMIHIDSNDNGYYLINPYAFDNAVNEKPDMFPKKLEFAVNGNPLILILPLKL